MKKDTLLKALFATSFILLFIGVALKIMHISTAVIFLYPAFLLSIAYTVMALMEVLASKRLKNSEKMMWLTGFVFINTITGILYFITGRKRVI